MKNILSGRWQKIILVCAILLAAGFIVYMFFGSYFPGSSYWQQKKLLSDLERPYKTDTYGGKTPEEAFDMFLAALKSGDVDLASKYFEPDRQVEKLKDFQLSKKNGNLNGDIVYIEGVWNKKQLIRQEDAEVMYEYKIKFSKQEPVYDNDGNTIDYVMPNEEYSNNIIFLLNPYTKVWKISEI